MLNFFGTGLDQKNIKKCMKELEKDMSSDYPVGQIEFQVGNYTEQINKQLAYQKTLTDKKDNINSKEYIEEVAREKLDMYLPNERVYIDKTK